MMKDLIGSSTDSIMVTLVNLWCGMTMSEAKVIIDMRVTMRLDTPLSLWNN
jgi:hypothetical protein